MSTSLDSRFFHENFLAWMKITIFSPGKLFKGNVMTFLMLVGLGFN